MAGSDRADEMRPVLRAGLAVMLVAVAGLALSGCGRRGDLEAPSRANLPAATETSQTVDGQTVDGKTDTESDVEDKPFVLDPLL